MRIFSKLAALSFVYAVGLAPALAADDWIKLAETDGTVWEGRARSLAIGKNNNGEEIYRASGRATNRKTTRIDFEQWYVKVTDCRAGSGKLITTDISGNYKYETDFVLRGGSVASTLADVVCSYIVDGQKKGIAS